MQNLTICGYYYVNANIKKNSLEYSTINNKMLPIQNYSP